MAKAMTDLRDEVRSGLQEPNAKFFTDTEIYRWLNYGMQLFAKATKCLKGYSSYSWTLGTAETSLTTVVGDSTRLNVVIDNAEWTGGTSGCIPLIVSKREIQIINPDQHVTASQIQGSPNRLYYDPYAKVVGLYPVPDVTGTLKVFYSYDLADIGAATNIDSAIEPYWVDVCAYAISRGMLKDVDRYSAQEASLHYERFKSAITKLRLENYVKEHPEGTINFIRDYPAWR